MNTKKKWLLLIFLVLPSLFLAGEEATDWLKMAVKAHQEGLYAASNRQIEKFLKSASATHPQRDYGYLLQAVNYLQLKKLPEAENSLLFLIANFPQSSYVKDGYTYLILLHLTQGKLPQAFSEYLTFKKKFGEEEKLSSQVAMAIFSQAVKLFQQNDYRSCRDLLEKFLAEFPEHKQAQQASYYLGLVLYQENSFAQAAVIFERLLKGKLSEVVMADVYLKLGDCYLNTGNLEKASQCYQKVISDFPSFSLRPAAIFNLAVIARRQGSYAMARRLLKEIADSKPEPRMMALALMELGRISMLEEKWNEAADFFREIMEKYPQSEVFPESLLQMGMVYFNQNKLEEAASYFQKFLDSSSDEKLKMQGYFGLGYTFYKRGEISAARSHWDKILEKMPTSTLASECLFLLGRKEFESGHYQDSSGYLQRLLKDFPETNLAKLALPLLVESYLQEKKLAEAKQLCERYLSSEQNEQLKVLYGKVLYLNNELEKARKVLSQVSKSSPALKAESLFYLAQVELACGRKEEAQERLLEIITFYPRVGNWSRLAKEALDKNKE